MIYRNPDIKSKSYDLNLSSCFLLANFTRIRVQHSFSRSLAAGRAEMIVTPHDCCKTVERLIISTEPTKLTGFILISMITVPREVGKVLLGMLDP